MGLIRAEAEGVSAEMISGVDAWPNDTAEALALLFRLKNGHRPDEQEMQRLTLIVRGGAGLQDPLRAQAAWLYLKLTRQDSTALAAVLDQQAQ